MNYMDKKKERREEQRKIKQRRSLQNFRSQFLNNLRRLEAMHWKGERDSEMVSYEVESVVKRSTKEWGQTVERRKSYDAPKMAQSNGKLRQRTDFSLPNLEKMKLDFIQCFSIHCDVVHPSKFKMIGWPDDYEIDPLRVIRCLEFIFWIGIYKL